MSELFKQALERIADPRNTHFSGDAQVVAREALAKQDRKYWCSETETLCNKCKDVCEAKQEQGEPVGEILLTNGDYKEVSWKNGKLPPIGAKLYTTLQPAQKPMTDEQIFGLLVRIDEHAVRLPKGLLAFARAIEAAHGIKE